MQLGGSSFHVELELQSRRRVGRIIRFYGYRFGVNARCLSGVDLDFDCAGLTRPQDFREVHGGASSAGYNRFNIEIGSASVLYYNAANQALVLRLFAEVNFLGRRDQMWNAAIGGSCRGSRCGCAGIAVRRFDCCR